MKADANDVTVRLDKVRGDARNPAPPAVTPQSGKKQTANGSSGLIGGLPRWVLPLAAAVVVLLIVIIVPILLHDQHGFTVVIKNVPPGSQVFVDDVLRGIPGVEKTGQNVAGVIRVHGLKAGIRHAVRVGCGGGNATLHLDNNSAVDGITAQDGEVVNVTAKDCGQQIPLLTEIDYNGKMRLVGKSAFIMGDDQGQANEKPAHLVNVEYDYYIDKFEVTNQQFREFCNQKGRKFPTEPWWDPSYSSNNQSMPVVGVTWDDARSYCEEWGKNLPTEAEWEKAASWDPKATDASARWKRRWPWGNDFAQGRANSNSNHPTTVGQYQEGVSAYGVYDMAGNAFEWVLDSYNPYPGNQTPDPQFGPANKVVRGGSFKTDSPDFTRTTFRVFRAASFSDKELKDRTWLIGFRCAIKRENPRLQASLGKNSQVR